LNELVQQILSGDLRSIARAISLIENEAPHKESLLDELYPYCGKAQVWGLTGAPGAGKSSLLDKIITLERAQGKRIAVIAVDPSSPFSGGAILGDRLRMQRHALDDQVFIRSMASRGHLGGIAGATRDAVKVFDAAGFDLIIIETIGVGQNEIEIVTLADLVILVLVPGLGDEIQALKAGIMEIGDLYVINKKDLEGAVKLKTQVEYVLQFKNDSSLKNPLLMTSASLNEGITELVEAAERYYDQLQKSGRLAERRRQRLKREFREIIHAKIRQVVEVRYGIESKIQDLTELVWHHHEKPYRIINNRLQKIIKELNQQ